MKARDVGKVIGVAGSTSPEVRRRKYVAESTSPKVRGQAFIRLNEENEGSAKITKHVPRRQQPPLFAHHSSGGFFILMAGMAGRRRAVPPWSPQEITAK